MRPRYLPEEVSSALVDHELAVRAATLALIAAAGSGASFPAILGHGSDPANRFSVKAGSTDQLAGLKVGSYWPANDLLNLPRHSSCILLFDQTLGRIGAFIEASRANAFRTAAANALAVDRLARPEAHRLAIFGAGQQAAYECAAVMKVRSIDHVAVVNRDPGRAHALAAKIRAEGVEAEAASAQDACRDADIIVTVTAAREPLFEAPMVGPGTHVSCMGADAYGKQEAPRALLLEAQLFCDHREQALSIGEFQHVADAVAAGQVPAPTNLGDVLSGRAPGRTDEAAITVFDSSGIALQDLFLGMCLLERAEERNVISNL